MEGAGWRSVSVEDTFMEDVTTLDNTYSSLPHVRASVTAHESAKADMKLLEVADESTRDDSRVKDDPKAIEQIRNELQNISERLEEAQSKRKMAEDHAKEGQRQLEEAEANSHTLQKANDRATSIANAYKRKFEARDDEYKRWFKNITDQLQASEQSRKMAEDKARTLESRVLDVKAELGACKDELFNLQPAAQVTDAQIIAEWNALCDNIVHWIENQSGGMSKLSLRLQDLSAKDQYNDAIRFFWGKETQLLAKNHPNILEDLLRYNIHLLLERNVFDENLYVLGILKREAIVLSAVEKTMSTLEPKRDLASIGTWRSEALNAICSTSGFALRQREAALEITREAEDFLPPLLPDLKEGAMELFHSEITEIAIKFASTMKRSPAYYRFVFRLHSNAHISNISRRPNLPLPGEGVPLFPSDVNMVDILDMESRTILKPNMTLHVGKDSSIGRRILIIHPALYRRTETEEILLRKQVVLTELPKTFQRRAKARDVEGSRNLFNGLFNFS